LTRIPFSDTLREFTCIAMKPILFLLMMVAVAATLVADEPKASPQRSAEEISRQIELLKARVSALEQEKKLLQNKSDEVSKFQTARIRVIGASQGKYGYVVIVDPTNAGVIKKALETGGVEYTTPKMGVEMAERHSAEKIKARVREADAKAKRILEGNPPSQVHGN
jgi:hypothetical protein